MQGAGPQNLRAAVSPVPDKVYYDFVDDHGRLAGGVVSASSLDDHFARGDSGSGPKPPSPSPSTTIIDHGPASNRIDLVMLGDGYTASEIEAYSTHVDNIFAPFFAMSPLDEYYSFFNVHRVDVVSNQSGVDGDPTQGVQKDTALDAGYWCGGIERLLCVNTAKASTEAESAPDVDQILVLANSTKYGGAGYPSANLGTVAGNNSSAVEVAKHEFGHSFADLADEYDYADGATYSGPEPGEPNISIKNAAQIAASQTKWHRWLDLPNVDAIEGAQYSQFGIYRATVNSLMRSLGQPLEEVNVEQFIISAYKTVRPIDDATAAGTYGDDRVFFVTPVQPVNHDLDIQWFLDGNAINGATDPTLDVAFLGLAPGTYTLEVVVTDNTDMVRDEAQRALWLSETRGWTLEVGEENSAPVLNTAAHPRLPTINEGAVNPAGKLVSNLVGNAITDVDGDLEGIAIINTPSTNGRWQYSLNGGANWNDVNAAPGVSARLLASDSQTRVRFLPNTHYAGGASFTYRAWDRTQGTAGTLVHIEGVGGSTPFSSAVEGASITVNAVNDRPILGGISGTVGYLRNSPRFALAPAAMLSDIDSPNFSGGQLRIRVEGIDDASNRLYIGMGFPVDASNRVFKSGVQIGTRVSNGLGTNDLVINFNSNATVAIAQQLIRSIRFRTINGSLGVRNVIFSVSDGDGGTSVERTRNVNVTN